MFFSVDLSNQKYDSDEVNIIKHFMVIKENVLNIGKSNETTVFL